MQGPSGSPNARQQQIRLRHGRHSCQSISGLRCAECSCVAAGLQTMACSLQRPGVDHLPPRVQRPWHRSETRAKQLDVRIKAFRHGLCSCSDALGNKLCGSVREGKPRNELVLHLARALADFPTWLQRSMAAGIRRPADLSAADGIVSEAKRFRALVSPWAQRQPSHTRPAAALLRAGHPHTQQPAV